MYRVNGQEVRSALTQAQYDSMIAGVAINRMRREQVATEAPTPEPEIVERAPRIEAPLPTAVRRRSGPVRGIRRKVGR